MGKKPNTGPPVVTNFDRKVLEWMPSVYPDMPGPAVKVPELAGQIDMVRGLVELADGDIRRAQKSAAFRRSADYRETLAWLASDSEEPGSLEWTCFILTRLTRATFVASRIREQLLTHAPTWTGSRRKRRLRIQPLGERRKAVPAEEPSEVERGKAAA